MSVFEGFLKTMALPAITAVAGLAYVSGWGPYGFAKPMPRCSGEPPCIIVAGLDGDVRYLPTGADASLVDLNDESATRLVVWLREALPALDPDQAVHAQRAVAAVLKYPRGIGLGEPGTPNELDMQARALERAVALGLEHNADLVVLGAVDGPVYELAFINPDAPPPRLTLTRFPSEGTRAPQGLGQALRGALAGVAPAAPLLSAVATPPAGTPRATPVTPPASAPPAASPPPRDSMPVAMPAPSAPRPQPQPPRLPPPSSDQRQTQPNPVSVTPPRPAPTAPPPRATSLERGDILQRAGNAGQHYPTRALEREREGVVRLHCTVRGDGSADCVVFSEEPSGWGFGEAAMRASRDIRVRTVNAAGQSTVGVVFYETIRFQLGG